MNHWVAKAWRQILPIITTAVLILAGTAWAQETAEPQIRVTGPFNSGVVYSLAFSPDGKMLASGSGDKTIRLWEMSTGRLIRSFAGHGDVIRCVAFSPDGKTLASGSADSTIKLWQVETGKQVRLFNGHTRAVYSVAFSPDGKLLASTGEDGNESSLRLWEVSTGRQIRAFEERNQWVTSVAFSPDGKMLASGSNEYVIKLWEVSTGNLIRTFAEHRNTIYSVAFSPDGKTLASGSGDNKVKLWEVSTGRVIRTLDGRSFNAVAFSPDGKRLAAGSDDRIVRLWEVDTGDLVHAYEGQNYYVHSLAYSPDGKTIASGGSATIRVWSVGSKSMLGSLLHYHDGNWIAFTPGNYYISSEGAAQYIAWRQGGKEYEEAQFRPRFYQPDKVAAGLSGKEVINQVSSVTTGGNKPNAAGNNPAATGPVSPPIRDTTAPKIVITSPAVTRGIGTNAGAAKMTVMGQAFDDSGVKQVVVRGAIARLDIRGNFSAEVPLEVGNNLITVTATDLHGNQASESFIIRREPIAAPTASVETAGPARGGRYHALLIAVQQYDHQSINSLDYPVNDAQQVERELTGRYTFDPQHVTMLKNPDRRAILDALDQMTERLTPEDNLLIFYAGHGQWDEQRKQGYWLPRDAMRERRADWISNSDLRDAIRGIKARHILLVSDACFAGGIFLAREAFGPASSAIAELNNLTSRTAMTSGALTTVPDRSVFVEYLLKRLRENTEGRLPAMELFNKLRLPVINNSPAQRDGSRPTPRYGTIFEVGDEGGDFIFVRR
ncbi:MAG TPA: caspase family protein [Blastocatellia bacterium]|nr:caspase family protein [Blastocatellia bacterium]